MEGARMLFLAASKSDRWAIATFSKELEEAIKDEPQTGYAAEGELTHELAQIMLGMMFRLHVGRRL